jgi:hypothetical protein
VTLGRKPQTLPEDLHQFTSHCRAVSVLVTLGRTPRTLPEVLHQFVLAFSRKLLDIERSKTLFELKFQRKKKLIFSAQKDFLQVLCVKPVQIPK